MFKKTYLFITMVLVAEVACSSGEYDCEVKDRRLMMDQIELVKKSDKKTMLVIPGCFEVRSLSLVRTDNLSGYMYLKFAPFVEQFIDECMKKESALEIGCAFGLLAVTVASKNPKIRYKAIDISDTHISYLDYNLRNMKGSAWSKTPPHSVTTLCGDIATKYGLLEYNTYDVSMMARVLEYLSPDEQRFAFKQIFAALKTGGSLYVTTASERCGYVQRSNLVRIIYSISSFFCEHPGYFPHFYLLNGGSKPYSLMAHFMTPSDLRKLAQDTGFVVSAISYISPAGDDLNMTYGQQECVALIAKKPDQETLEKTSAEREKKRQELKDSPIAGSAADGLRMVWNYIASLFARG